MYSTFVGLSSVLSRASNAACFGSDDGFEEDNAVPDENPEAVSLVDAIANNEALEYGTNDSVAGVVEYNRFEMMLWLTGVLLLKKEAFEGDEEVYASDL